MQETNLFNEFYKPLKLKRDSITHQFILTKNSNLIPDDWSWYEKGHWFLGVSELPVLTIENAVGQMLGWCIGYPINIKKPWNRKIVIDCKNSEAVNMKDVENFYQDTGGRFILILLAEKDEKFFLDPTGNLAAVFSISEPTVASTPTLFGEKYEWDTELILSLNMPIRNLRFPSGLTPKKGIRRLLPNHYLNLKEWSVVRHWPVDSSELAVEEDIEKNLSIITSCIKNTIEIIAEKYPIQLALTAGRDTRMLLACAKDCLSKIQFFTFSSDDETVDMYIASKLANKFNLNHSFVQMKSATDDEMLHWLYLTGHAVGGAVWKIHKTLESYDPQRVLLNGILGEVGRGRFWNESDSIDTKLSATDLLKKGGYPPKYSILADLDNWLSELSDYNAFAVLDLFTLEQIDGCWSSPQFYANTYSQFEICPFNNRRIFRAMMKLPYEYRFQQQLPEDICNTLWPELLELPFNEFIGLRNYFHKTKTYITNTKKRGTETAKRLIKRVVNKSSQQKSIKDKLPVKSLSR